MLVLFRCEVLLINWKSNWNKIQLEKSYIQFLLIFLQCILPKGLKSETKINFPCFLLQITTRTKKIKNFNKFRKLFNTFKWTEIATENRRRSCMPIISGFNPNKLEMSGQTMFQVNSKQKQRLWMMMMITSNKTQQKPLNSFPSQNR